MRSLAVAAITLSLAGCSDESLRRSDSPIASSASLGHFNPPLPSNAFDIYFLDFAGGLQDLEKFVRFSVPPTEVGSAVDKMIARNNRQMGRSLVYPLQSIAAAPTITPRSGFLPMPWWTPSAISSGYYRGEQDSYALQIWVDTASGTIFVYQND
ncbi:MAG: hypothetical protein QM680_06335 [Luteolibacter sp.]